MPAHTVDRSRRWGDQLFALPAEGFETVEFVDEDGKSAYDGGLMRWLIGSVSSFRG